MKVYYVDVNNKTVFKKCFNSDGSHTWYYFGWADQNNTLYTYSVKVPVELTKGEPDSAQLFSEEELIMEFL